VTDYSSFRLLEPSWLLLLPLLWWLTWLLARNHLRPSMWRKLCDPRLLENLRTDQASTAAARWLIWPLSILLTLSVLAAAGPSWRQQTHPIMESASARIVALELSGSMLVQDVKPNRFAQAIAAAREIIDADFEGETGLLVFSGAAFVVSPLSRDANTLLAFIDSLEPGMLPLEGQRVDLAIGMAQDLLQASISGQGHIIVITSGTEQNSNAVRVATSARLQGHRVSIMAAGTSAGGPLIEPGGALARDGNGKLALARTSFTELNQVATAGGGSLIRLGEANAANVLLGSRIMANNLVEVMQKTGDEDRGAANDGAWLVWLILPFALLLFRRNLFWVIMVATCFPLGNEAYAADKTSIWQHREQLAYKSYQQADFKRAGQLSRDPLLKGAAYYRDGNYQQALESFGMDDSAQSYYNLGNTLVQLDQLPEAITSYTRALEIDPLLGQARYNRRLLEIFLQQQQEAQGDLSAESGSETGGPEPPDQSDSENGPGTAEQGVSNPGDEDAIGSGFGASIQSGQPELYERFDGLEQQLERFSLEQGINPEQAVVLVEQWVKGLPATSSELFRRKFLRDYQRQRRQPR